MVSELKVSIITVVYNGVKHLEQTIKSVLNQTYANIEYIIIDGGSTDGTINIIKKYESNIAHWVSEPDSGIYDAMNKGIKMATGELIGIINSDDWYEPYAVEEIVMAYKDNTVCYGLMRHISNDEILEIYAPAPCLIPKKMIPHSTCFVPSNIYRKYGLFDLQYKSCADYHLILRLYKAGVKFEFIEKVIANFRFGGYSWKTSSLRESFNMRYKMGVISLFERNVKILAICLLKGKLV